jgi:2-polyprenyl-3-methyl-5-hydroxy-6-metoxy-1,4-benzoquinol methylase
MSCYLCKSDKYSKRTGSVRDNSNIDILECSDCGLVYLSSLEHIQDGHYEASGMHDDKVPNIDKWLKETEFDDKRRYDFVKEKIANKNVLDFGCGVGGFLEMAIQSARKASGVELERALQLSFQERELNVFPNLREAQEQSEKYDIITAFHVVEHLQNPKQILGDLSLNYLRKMEK